MAQLQNQIRQRLIMPQSQRHDQFSSGHLLEHGYALVVHLKQGFVAFLLSLIPKGSLHV